jgi:hypothetical protein
VWKEKVYPEKVRNIQFPSNLFELKLYFEGAHFHLSGWNTSGLPENQR